MKPSHFTLLVGVIGLAIGLAVPGIAPEPSGGHRHPG